MQPQSMPLLPLLLHCPKTSTENSPTIEAEKMADQFIIKYNLNEDQVHVPDTRHSDDLLFCNSVTREFIVL